jgi:hypothetical protein
MLFLLAMEHLNLLFKKAQNDGLLSNLNPQFEAFRVSMYADDVAIFIGPTTSNLRVTNHILEIFASASGLHTNLSKIEYYPIRCEGLDLSFLTSSSSSLSTFPTFYLGMPLGIKKPSRAVVQTLVQKAGNKLRG